VEAIGELPIIGGLVIQSKILRSHSNINKLHGVEGLGTSEDKKKCCMASNTKLAFDFQLIGKEKMTEISILLSLHG
jgi:hypothetical protein